MASKKSGGTPPPKKSATPASKQVVKRDGQTSAKKATKSAPGKGEVWGSADKHSGGGNNGGLSVKGGRK